MTDLDSCVRCHVDISDNDGAYCSDECKIENETPRTETFAPSPRAQEIQDDIEAAMERDGEVRIELNDE